MVAAALRNGRLLLSKLQLYGPKKDVGSDARGDSLKRAQAESSQSNPEEIPTLGISQESNPKHV